MSLGVIYFFYFFFEKETSSSNIEIHTFNCENNVVLYSYIDIYDTLNNVYYFKYADEKGVILANKKQIKKSLGRFFIQAPGYNNLCLKIPQKEIDTIKYLNINLTSRFAKKTCHTKFLIECD